MTSATIRNFLTAALGGLAVFALAAPAHAASRATKAGALDPLVSYYDVGENGGAGDNEVRLVNPTKASGDICAMVYVFDDDQEMGECCGCRLSPNKLLPLSVNHDLTDNWALSGMDTNSGVIVVVPTIPNSGTAGGPNQNGCDPTAAYTEVPSLNGWVTHVEHTNREDASSSSSVSVTPMAQDPTDTTEASYLIAQCLSNVSNGSGNGVCDCGPEKESGK
jgi:hypothetical protein